MAAPDIAPRLMPAVVAGRRLDGSAGADGGKGMIDIDPGDRLVGVGPGTFVSAAMPFFPFSALKIISVSVCKYISAASISTPA